LLQRDPVGEAILLDEMLMGIDLEGDEPGEVSKCIVAVYRVGLVVYIHDYGRCRPESSCRRMDVADGLWFFV
jgi:hypothetical protein